MLDPHLHLDTEILHRELRDVALHQPRLDRPDYQRHGRLRRRLRTFVLSPARIAHSEGAVPEVTIRLARTADAGHLTRLAELSERRVPSGRVLVAEVGSDILAAVSVDGGPMLSDLVRPTADVAQLLELRSEQLRAA